MRQFKSRKAREFSWIIGKDDVAYPNGFTADSHSSADLLAENKRIARHLVKRGSLAGKEPEFTYHAAPEIFKEYRERVGIPHFCDDCAHQGNHTPQQLGPKFINSHLSQEWVTRSKHL